MCNRELGENSSYSEKAGRCHGGRRQGCLLHLHAASVESRPLTERGNLHRKYAGELARVNRFPRK